MRSEGEDPVGEEAPAGRDAGNSSAETVAETADGPTRARVLVVDDSLSSRRKLVFALRTLGHEAHEADGGRAALERLQHESFDLVVLDIVMPEIDGFEVLRFVKRHETLREIPVIVVSGLENEPGAVIEAIRLGAEDFLPKSFEPVLLRARVGAGLRKKRNRDRELAELAEIRRLTDAAALLEGSLVSGERLGLGDLAGRNDPLGRFAAVFARLAATMHARERRLQRQLAARRGLALLLAAGTLFGLNVPLSRMVVTEMPHPMGLSLWINAVSALICLGFGAVRGRLPRPSWPIVRFALLWGLFGATLAEIMLFHAAALVPASTLSVIVVLESSIVFAIAALVGHERATAKRLSGLLLGFVGILLVVRTHEGGFAFDGLGGVPWWALVALAVPLCYAIEDLLLAMRLPPDLDIVVAVGLASLAGTMLLAPVVWWTNDAVSLGAMSGSAAFATAGIVVGSIGGTVLHTRLTASAGAVFASQVSYAITFAGIFWAMLLLGERPAAGIWGALALMLVGLMLVEPKREPDDVLAGGVFSRA